jgi:hypothetical protein
VFSDFGPNQSYPKGGTTYEISGDSFIAEQFVGDGNAFTGASLALGWFSGVNQFLINLRADDRGKPGAVMESFLVTNVPDFRTGGGVVTVRDPDPFTDLVFLETGRTYWLEAEPGVPGFRAAVAGWFPNDQYYAGVWRSPDGVLWVYISNDPEAAFEVDSTAAVPAPAGWVLAVIGVSCAGAGLVRGGVVCLGGIIAARGCPRRMGKRWFNWCRKMVTFFSLRRVTGLVLWTKYRWWKSACAASRA